MDAATSFTVIPNVPLTVVVFISVAVMEQVLPVLLQRPAAPRGSIALLTVWTLTTVQVIPLLVTA